MSHEIGAYTSTWGPGHTSTSPNIQIEGLLPGAGVRSPLQAGVVVVLSTAEETRPLHAVIRSVVGEEGE